ncbi:hypothetical protein HGRIS_009029 [Hohenbuehelia grisea]|uniref:Flavin-containing monooxygenase n=1 Tax=Hohenbuehelia grisea TaxID=104357 RepID=A0ABR3IZW4_9AGAR
MVSAAEIASSWLHDLAAGFASASIDAVVDCFHPEGWLRDQLVFTWEHRALEGHGKIRNYLVDNFSAAQISDMALDARPELQPVFGPMTPVHTGISAGFTFSTPIAHGEGFFRLTSDPTSEEWKALTVYMSIRDLKGYEESGPELGVYGGHTIPWQDEWRDRVARTESNVEVVIIGGAQSGLNVAARFKQMNIPTIVIEQSARVGDVWRKRYPTLTLHTPRSQHQMLYQSFPKNWPTYTPRDKLANWLEQYVYTQDLIVWTNSKPLPEPFYDTSAKRWTLSIDRNGTVVELHPAHIIVAAGTLGSPSVPHVPTSPMFRGTILHTGTFNGGSPFTGQKVVVVGAGNTSADICQDLVNHNAASVTLIQRSSSCVVSAGPVTERLLRIWPEGVPTDIADFKAASMPFGLLRKIFTANSEEEWEPEKEMHAGLIKAGIKLNRGPGGAGQLTLVFERLGGYWLDVGSSKLIAEGKIKVKQGVEVDHFTEDSVVFTDGSLLEADVVIFATGYRNIREDMAKLFGSEAINQTGDVWGLDEEGEIKGSYKPSGHPGLWFAAGDFYQSRYMSKRMALEIKAIQLGLRS